MLKKFTLCSSSSCILNTRSAATVVEQDPEMAANIYGFTAKDIDGQDVSMEKYR
jgi:hypothetical protein